MRAYRPANLLIALIGASVLCGAAFGADSDDRYMAAVRGYVDAMLEQGRDRYGETQSPLIASAMDRKSMELPGGQTLQRLLRLQRSKWGIRPFDRTLTGANPMHDQNLYQVMYALTELTGEKRYADEADRTLAWFFNHCQSDTTHLMAWGEHMGWDFRTEKPINTRHGDIHEFFRPWVLWERTFELTPEPAARFARGLWEHQIADHKTGDFSRHALYSKHGPGTSNQYPRHGGFYIATWAEAYRRTKEPVFLEAIQTIIGFYQRHRSKETGAIPAEIGNPRSKNKMMWPPSNVSLAVDLWDSAPKVDEKLGEQLRAIAKNTDAVFLKLPHSLGADGEGFVGQSHVDTLGAVDVRNAGKRVHSHLWATGYGQATDAKIANLCLVRHAQMGGDGYRGLILAASDRYMNTEPNIDYPIYPGTLGDVICLMLGAHRLTGEKRYLDRADHFADRALAMFFDDTSPLPKASSQHDHYEAITCADTLALGLLKLWVQKNRPDADVRLIWNDR